MSATKAGTMRSNRCVKSNQGGVAAVEFMMVATAFFTIVFGIIELARAMYLFNTMAEVTRRAAHEAANVSFRDSAELDLVRKRAVFDETNGNLPFGSPITYRNIRIEHLYLPKDQTALKVIPDASLPSCPAKNRLNCMTDPNSASCIRAVQARICQETAASGACTPVTYQSVVSFINLPLRLPTSLTIVSAETLGYKKGDLPCP